MKTSAILMQFMRIALAHQDMILSWGISNILISSDAIKFKVCGFKFSGDIIVADESNSLKINMSDKYVKYFESAEDAILYIDSKVEFDDFYFQRVIGLVLDNEADKLT